MSPDDPSALLATAMKAQSSTEPPDLVKHTTALADALGVTRQSVHAWRRRADAPKRTGGFWSIGEWQDYMKKHQLADTQSVGRIAITAEVCQLIVSKLPPQMSRQRLRQLLARVETALRSSLNGTRFRS